MASYSGRWTNSDNIKAHLQSAEVEFPSIVDSPLDLTELDNCQLPNNNITENTEVVKIQRTLTPTQTTALLTGTIPALINPYLIKNSIIVATDILMSTIYVENKDYIVKYDTGTIERASTGSAITSGTTVYVWYISYEVTIKNTDYAISYDAGTINRIAGTSIPNGATVYVDYSHALSSITDDLIKRAIIESEEFIADRITNVNTQDEGITTVANYYSMAIICLSQSVKELKSRSDNSNDLSKEWRLLHDSYVDRAITVFKRYSKSLELNPGGVFQNRYSRDRIIQRTSPSIATGYRKR